MATSSCTIHSCTNGSLLRESFRSSQSGGLSGFQSTFLPGSPLFQGRNPNAKRPGHERVLKRPAYSAPSDDLSNFSATTRRHVCASIRAHSYDTIASPSSIPQSDATSRERDASPFSSPTPRHSRAAIRRGSIICRVMGMATAQLKGLQDNIFIRHSDDDCWVCGADTGPLWGLTFALKDMYDVQGVPTGFGSPTWRKTHAVPKKSAPIVDALLNAGATLLGKTVMDEMAFSLTGVNAHYGTPVNPAAPGRIPGGSSSGSAAAVAAKLVDFAIGSDTAGSIRVPASHCGVLGMRPSHGRISMEGARPLQPTLDAVGWFANDPHIFRSVGEVLLSGTCLLEERNSAEPTSSPAGTSGNGKPRPERKLKRWLVATDAFTLADEAAAKAIYDELLPHMSALCEMLSSPEEITVATEEGGLAKWMEHARTIQLYEAWQQHGEWIRTEDPKLGPGVRERFAAASEVSEEQWREATAARERFSDHMRTLLADGAVLMVPSAPGIAPLKKAHAEELEAYRSRILQLSVIAGPSGLPQVNLPIAEVDGCPVGLGIIGPRGWDEELLDLTVQIMELVRVRKPSPSLGADFEKFVVPPDP
ncbi:aspartyl/glutamyl-tRNA amidotransferase subunit A [Klebsormidium nitens]|uniref:Aspartyl/glutamyl-tRNA amidotransferase subunit A n=1 Tax=Klebsormidium nitens TaxID=105231 RepID=A0A1Y1HVY2_KLENI|nr:aspartyl/glutamyl-tRNA amidotransferase subunit A [Klebsormidium nitens]|eukprot:GAQ80687.1 aspartyl/glutamyl-tRNA amidotransferase subunit A [Klebsormidium nitens]